MDSVGESAAGSSATARLSPIASTSNYIVQLDPSSGHFEIVDSNMAVPTNRTAEMESDETDEAVYKIRDEDFCFRGPFMDTGFSEMDIDPVVEFSDLICKPLQGFLQDEPMQPMQVGSFTNLTSNFSGYEEISLADRETVQQAIDVAYGSGSMSMSIGSLNSNNVIQGGNDVIFYTNSNVIPASTLSTSTLATMQSQQSDNFMSATQNVQTNSNNLIPVTLPTMQNQSQSDNFTPVILPTVSRLNQEQQVIVSVTEQFPTQQNSVEQQNVISNHDSFKTNSNNSEVFLRPPPPIPSDKQLQSGASSEPPKISLENLSSEINDEQKPTLFSNNNLEQLPSAVTSSENPCSSVTIVQVDNNIDQKLDESDSDFNIKIVSCYSQAAGDEESKEDMNESSVDNNVTVVEDASEDMETLSKNIGDNNEPTANDNEKKSVVGESKKETISDSKLNVLQTQFPHLPEWLFSGIDKKDELFIAFKNRPDPSKAFICVFCYNWFAENNELKQHIINNHAKPKTKFHKCRECGKKFIARILRLRHEALHKYDLKYPHFLYDEKESGMRVKNHFSKRFQPAPVSDVYKSHVKEMCNFIEDLPFECCDCDLRFSDEEVVREHYEQFHAVQSCGVCGEVSKNLTELVQHEKDFHGQYEIRHNYDGGAWYLWDDWLCEESIEKEEVVSNIAYFHNYLKLSSDEPVLYEEDFVEQNLDKMQHNSFNLDYKSVSVKSEPTEYKEDMDYMIAGQMLDENDDIVFITERSIKHENPDDLEFQSTLPYKCDSCAKSYDNEHDLKRHARCHTGEKQTLECQFCGKSFKTHSHKKEHERTHTGEKPYTCPICSRSFIQSSNLKKHIQTHKSQNTLQCGICGKQFIKEASLALHQRAHAQDRKFRCEICDRAYNYASLLKRHMRIHTGEMPYSCEQCGMLFHELVSLHYHRKKVHTGERPHRCETCGRAFILSSDLKKHIQIHLKPPSDKPVVKASPRRRSNNSKSFEGEILEMETNGISETNEIIEDQVHNITNDIAKGDDISSLNSITEEKEEPSSPAPPPPNPTTEIEHIPMQIKKRSEETTQLSLSPLKPFHHHTDEMPNVTRPSIIKPPVLRVYKRRDTKTFRSEVEIQNVFNDQVEQQTAQVDNTNQPQSTMLLMTNNNNVTTTQQENFGNLNLAMGGEQSLENNSTTVSVVQVNEVITQQNNAPTEILNYHEQNLIVNHTNCEIIDLESTDLLNKIDENKMKLLSSEMSSENTQMDSQAGTLTNLSSEMLQEQFGTMYEINAETSQEKMFQVSSLEQLGTGCSDNNTAREAGPDIDDVLQLTELTSFSDLDMSDMIVVPPEVSSEIEIILDHS